MQKRIWLDKPTENYVEGLPVGNGRLAAMMLGRPEKLRIALNHEWLFRGENRYRDLEPMHQHLSQVRQALVQGDFLQGTALTNEYFAGTGGMSKIPSRIDPYQPAGDLWVEMDADEPAQYVRSVDLSNGLAETTFISNGNRIRQKLFASLTDGCIVVEITAEKPRDVRVILTRVEDEGCTLTYAEQTDGLYMQGALGEAVSFAVGVKAHTDGVLESGNDTLLAKNATRLLLFVQIGTNVKGNAPDAEITFPENCDFDSLFDDHKVKFSALLGDTELTVDLPEYDLPTDQRLKLFAEGKDPGLALLFYEYARYFLVTGSSADLPLNLQGKWNEEIMPPWKSDYHLDINLQMCYWIADTMGMDWANNALFSWMESNVPFGRTMAKKLFDCKGFTIGIATDAWGRATYESRGWAVWHGAAPWLANHMFMHWRYTRDKEFLEKRCYPFLKGAAEFYEDYLFEHNGELWVAPSQSPENSFAGTEGWPVSICVNSTVDIELITDLLTNAAECADVLGVDGEQAALWRDIITRLPKLTTDSKGRLNEWDKEREEKEPGHRHLSHLYGLHPAQLFAPDSWQWKAAERSFETRMQYAGEMENFAGFSLAWAACMYARLGRAEEAWEQFEALIRKNITISLWDAAYSAEFFQIDANMGGAAYICEALLHSRRDCLYLLPALPKAWQTGSVKNFRAQDGVTVSFTWENGKLQSFTLNARDDRTLQVCYGKQSWNLTLQGGKPLHIDVR